MKLFACMCNQPQRLFTALEPVRASLIAPASEAAPVSRWGLGYIQGGDALLIRTPTMSTRPVDLAAPLSDIATDCAIGHAVMDERNAFGGTDNTPPFRFRRWLFTQTGLMSLTTVDQFTPRILEYIPEYLRRNMRGRTPAELIFHLFLAMLHDEGNLDDPNLPTSATRRALAATLRLLGTEFEKLERPEVTLGTMAATNGRSMVVARLDEPLRLRRLTIANERLQDRGGIAFRGVLLVSGHQNEGEAGEGFEHVPKRHSVLISRDLQVTFADLDP